MCYRRVALLFFKVIHQISRSKVADFDPNWVFPDCNSSLYQQMALKWHTKLDVVLKRCPIIFQGHLSNFKVIPDKKIADFYPNWEFLVCNWFEFTHGFEMIHKAWRSIEKVSFCFTRSSIEFQGQKNKKMPILTPIECFRTVTLVWIHHWIWNDVQSLT